VQFCETAAHLGELSQQAVGVLGPDFSHRLQQIKKKKKEPIICYLQEMNFTGKNTGLT
jgi:hypothetical protein